MSMGGAAWLLLRVEKIHDDVLVPVAMLIHHDFISAMPNFLARAVNVHKLVEGFCVDLRRSNMLHMRSTRPRSPLAGRSQTWCTAAKHPRGGRHTRCAKPPG